MNRWAAKCSWIVAVASLAMMIGVRTWHSPLHHVLGCCHSADAESPSAAAHTHHGCGQKHSHSHAPAQVATSASVGSACGGYSHWGHSHSGQPSHGEHSEDCQLCQFLTQSLQPVALPVLLIGEDPVAEAPVDILPEIVSIALVSPPARGPPHLS